jgi:hypothetical protein
MLVQVVLLRHEGRRLTAEEVRQAPVLTGHIQVAREPGGRLGAWSRAAFLEVRGRDKHLSLHCVQLTRWTARGIVLMGTERHHSRRDAVEYPQSWWCRIAAGPLSGPGNSALDLDEEQEQLREAGVLVWALDLHAEAVSALAAIGRIGDFRNAHEVAMGRDCQTQRCMGPGGP